MRVTRDAEPGAWAPARRMADEPEEAHEREERLMRDLARAKCPMELEGGERLRRGGQAEPRIGAVDLDSDEGIQERKRAGHVSSRAQRLDQPDLGQRCVQLRRAGLPLDAAGRSHERAALAILLRPARRAVLGQPPAQIARLSHVEQTSRGVIAAIDAWLTRDSGQKSGAELPIEDAHAAIVSASGPIAETFSRAPPRGCHSVLPLVASGETMTSRNGAFASPHAHGGHHQAHVAHDKHAGHSVEMFRRKFWGTLLLSIPTVVWAPMNQHWLGYEAWGGPTASRFVSAFFGTLVFAYGGWVFVKGARGELADRRPGMMTLIALAISVAFVFSLAVTFGFPGMDLWWELATLVTVMILGHWIEMRSISQAQGALTELAKLLPDTAVRRVGAGRRAARGRGGVGARGRRPRRRWHRARRVERRQRVDDHRRVATRAQVPRRNGDCRNGERLGRAPYRGHAHWREDGARRHH